MDPAAGAARAVCRLARGVERVGACLDHDLLPAEPGLARSSGMKACLGQSRREAVDCTMLRTVLREAELSGQLW